MHGGLGCRAPIKKLFIFTLNISNFAKKKRKDRPPGVNTRKSTTF